MMSVAVAIAATTATAATAAPSLRYRSSLRYTQIHGLLQSVAFGILFPLGILVALIRNRWGPSWRNLHIALQTIATLFVIIALIFISIAHRNNEENTKPDEEPAATHHAILGSIVVTLLVIQWIWAIVARKYVDWTIWLRIHMILAFLILFIGWYQIVLGWRLWKN